MAPRESTARLSESHLLRDPLPYAIASGDDLGVEGGEETGGIAQPHLRQPCGEAHVVKLETLQTDFARHGHIAAGEATGE